MEISNLSLQTTRLTVLYQEIENIVESKLKTISSMNNNIQYNIYIDSVNGNDSNDGSSLHPIRSFIGINSLVNNKSYGLLQIVLKGDRSYIVDSIVYLQANSVRLLAWGNYNDFTNKPVIMQSDNVIDIDNSSYNSQSVSIKGLPKFVNSIGNIVIEDIDLKTAIEGTPAWPTSSNSIIFDKSMFKCGFGNFASIAVMNNYTSNINLFLEDGLLFSGSEISLYMSNCTINSITRTEREAIDKLIPIINTKLKELIYNNIILVGPFVNVAPSSLFYGSITITQTSNLIPDDSVGNIITTRSNINLADTNTLVQPIITSPTNNQDMFSSSITITSSAFDVNFGSDTHLNSTWELATDIGFTNIIQSSINSTSNKTSWSISGLTDLTIYYVRVKHAGTIFGDSIWSSINTFRITIPRIITPSITYPSVGATDITSSIIFTSSNFSMTHGSDTHISSSWELSTATGSLFEDNIVQSLFYSETNKTTWNVSTLSEHTIYYVRVRYTGTSIGDSNWSLPLMLTTAIPIVTQPIIEYPTNNEIEINTNVTFIGSDFALSYGCDDHLDSSWQLATDYHFTNIVQSITHSSSNKTAWHMTGLDTNRIYYVKVKYTSTSFGDSAWSSPIRFTTVTPVITKPIITYPSNNAIDLATSITFTSSNFIITNGTDTHLNSTWEISNDSLFTTLFIKIENDSINKTSWSIDGLSPSDTYYVRVKYTGSTGYVSALSDTISFSTIPSDINNDPVIRKPSILSPINNSIGQLTSLHITSSEFQVDNGTDTYVSTSWQLSKDRNFSLIDKHSYEDTINVNSWNISNLQSGTRYYIHVRYEGTTLGESAWSNTISFVTRSAPSTQVLQFVPTDTRVNMYFGSSVATNSNGRTFAISAPYNTYSGTSEVGSVYIYQFVSNNNYTREAKILAPVIIENGLFGHSVALSDDGNTLIIGANGQVNYTGRAYVFTRSGTTWSLEYTMIASDSAIVSHFGYDVALSADGNIALVSSTRRRNNGISGAGGVYVFVRSGTVWTQQTIIAASQPTASVDAYFGCAIALSDDGNTIVIGAYNTAYDTYIGAGRAYVFTRNGDNWDQRVILRPDAISAQAYGYFGGAIAISGDGSTIVISAPGTNDAAGLVFVFTGSGDTWDQVAKLLPNDIAANDHFGHSVAINNDGTIVSVSSNLDNNTNGIDAGSVYIYELTSTSPDVWTRSSKLLPTDGKVNNNFGTAVALSKNGEILIVGENNYNVNGLSHAGAAYVFD